MNNEKKLGLMSFWLFGTFIIIVVAVSVFAYLVPEVGTRIFGELNYWIFVGSTLVLSVAWYYIYRAILGRDEDDDDDMDMDHSGGMEE